MSSPITCNHNAEMHEWVQSHGNAKSECSHEQCDAIMLDYFDLQRSCIEFSASRIHSKIVAADYPWASEVAMRLLLSPAALLILVLRR